MFLSKLVLNSKNPVVRRHIGSPYEMHKAILGFGFGPIPKSELGRVLFRVDEDPTGRTPPVVLVQSEQEPAWGTLPENYTVAGPEWSPYDPKFRAGQKLRFRLRANPTKRLPMRWQRRRWNKAALRQTISLHWMTCLPKRQNLLWKL